ncbi:MAG: FGGY family carbohydrate kinase [Candidatus Nanopelagicales bacterium]
MALVAGVDSSTQSVKIVVRDADSGALVREARASHPDGTEVDPAAWVSALAGASDGLLDGVSAMAIGGQQHGMVALNDEGEVVRDALLWNDTRSAPDADDLIAELGGPQAWADAVGSVPVAAFTVTKVRWMARVEPENAARTSRVLLPHDYLTWLLAGRPDEAATDRGEASGTGYWSPITGEYRTDLLEMALGHDARLPHVHGPASAIGETQAGILLGPGTGDNMAAALGIGAGPGDVVVSLGTSGTAFAVSDVPAKDPSGLVAGFADATGHFLPLVCTLNAARVLSSTAAMLNVDLDQLATLALAAAPGAGGLSLLPYLDGERTPNLPTAQGSLHGLTRDNMTPENLARAAVEGMLGGLADAVDALVEVGVEPRRVILVGGAAANPAVGAVASTLFTVPVVVPPAGEYVADGAARQAAWVLAGGGEPPVWDDVRAGETRTYQPDPVAAVRQAYGRARGALYPA